MVQDEIDEPSNERLERLLVQAQSGDRNSQNELFLALQRYLDYLAIQHHNASLGGKLGASDIVQQTMLHAAEQFNQFRGQTAEEFRGWMRKILINQARELNRQFSAKRRNVAQEIALDTDQSTAGVGGFISDGEATPSVVLSAAEESQRILEILGKMPEEMRLVVQLRNWEGLQFNEIAERMGISLSQAAKLWYNALLELERIHSKSSDVES